MLLKERQGIRCKQLLNYIKEMTRYWKLKESVLDYSVWRSCFGRCYRHVIRQTTEWWMMHM